jgi:hypothetical protein
MMAEIMEMIVRIILISVHPGRILLKRFWKFIKEAPLFLIKDY